MLSAGRPSVFINIVSITNPAWGMPEAPMLAMVAIKLIIKKFN